MVLSEEVKQILRAYRVPVKRRYCQAINGYVIIDPETGDLVLPKSRY